jgi:hypothetical protein
VLTDNHSARNYSKLVGDSDWPGKLGEGHRRGLLLCIRYNEVPQCNRPESPRRGRTWFHAFKNVVIAITLFLSTCIMAIASCAAHTCKPSTMVGANLSTHARDRPYMGYKGFVFITVLLFLQKLVL